MNAFNLKEKYAGVYSANRVLTMFAFFFSRIATIPYFWMLTYRRYDDLINCDWKIIGMLIVSGIVLDFLNIQVILQSFQQTNRFQVVYPHNENRLRRVQEDTKNRQRENRNAQNLSPREKRQCLSGTVVFNQSRVSRSLIL